MGDSEHPEAVGYKRPPRQHRFTKGHSGNPKGRPKTAKKTKATKWRDMILEESQRTVQTSDGEVLTVKQALIRAIIQRAIKGSPQAMRPVLAMFSELDLEEDRYVEPPSDKDLANMTPEMAQKAYFRMIGTKK